MNVAISVTTQFLYRLIAKPVMFKVPPDTMHASMIRVASRLQHSGVLRWLMRMGWAYQRNDALVQTIRGVMFENPVGLSAGFDKNFELPLIMKSIGFGFMEGGSLTYQECAGNARPWFYRLPKTKSLVVHVGLANHGVDNILRRLQSYRPQHMGHFPLNISVAKTNSPQTCTQKEAVADYIASLRAIKKSGDGQMITLNISCPNTFGGEPFTTPAALEHLLQAVDAMRLTQPIFIKMPCDLPWHDFRALLKVAARHTVDGVTICNLAKKRAHISLRDHLPKEIQGGLSGKPTWDRSNDYIARTYRAYSERFVIIGVGGIFSADDAYAKIRAGAHLVELITGMVFEGPQLIGQINKGLVRLLERDGYQHIRQVVGIDTKND